MFLTFESSKKIIMKKFLLLAGFFMAANFINAQTADEVINKHIEAMGGLEKLNAIKTIYTEGVVVAPNGTEITIHSWIDNNKLYRREMDFGMGKGVMVLTDKGGWNSDRQGGMNQMKEEGYRRLEYQMDCAGPLVNYAAKGHKVELLGKETTDGKEYYKIKFTHKNGSELNFFIDAATYYISRMSFKGGMRGPNADPNAEMVVTFSNYAKTEDGFVFAYTTSTSGGFGGSLNLEKIEVNKPIEESKYKAE
jgi:hypothetical protein